MSRTSLNHYVDGAWMQPVHEGGTEVLQACMQAKFASHLC